MINKIGEYYKNLSDEELLLAINSIKISDDSGYVDDVIMHHCRKMREFINLKHTSLDITMTQMNLMKEASFRWLNLKIVKK